VVDEDAESIPDGTVLQTDVAIIGAGAAGITIARRLAGCRLKVLLIESGGDEAEDRFHTLARGEIVGTPYWPLDANRHRCIGGTTKVWAGWCRPLDNLDFAKREWVPWSGWPIARASLIPYYREAHEICQLGPFDYDVAAWERELKTHRLPLDERTVAPKMLQLSPPTRFGSTYLPVLRRAGNVSLVYHATVLEIETTPEGNVVRALRLGTLDGSRFRVEARSFVLATGGLENARLLLLSDRYRSAGLGNDNDHVGRYFMEHLHFTFGVGVLRWPRRQFERLYSPARRRAVGRIFVAPELQREQELLNGNVMLYPASLTGTAWWGQAVRRPIDRLQGGVMVRLAHTIEQPPNPASRLTFGGRAGRIRAPSHLPRLASGKGGAADISTELARLWPRDRVGGTRQGEPRPGGRRRGMAPGRVTGAAWPPHRHDSNDHQPEGWRRRRKLPCPRHCQSLHRG
jgi:hypothetical protein